MPRQRRHYVEQIEFFGPNRDGTHEVCAIVYKKLGTERTRARVLVPYRDEHRSDTEAHLAYCIVYVLQELNDRYRQEQLAAKQDGLK